MYDLLFGQNTAFFTIPAIAGTVVFMLRMGMLVFGGDDGDGLGLDVDGGGGLDGFDAGGDGGFDGLDADSEPLDHGGTDSDSAFSIVSLQSIAAFLMGAGWGGLGSYRGSGLSFSWSILIGVLCGVAMVWLLVWLMKLVYDLQSSGTVSVRAAVGRTGDVDVEVPGERSGIGTVRVVIDDRMRSYQAVTTGERIARGSSVKIVSVNADNSVTVTQV